MPNDPIPSFDETAAGAASALLYKTWMAGSVIGELPPDIRPLTREDGYRVQALLESRSPRPIHGWKVAATSVAGQSHIGVDGPLAGRILSERIIANGGSVPFHPNRMAVAEVEFAFRMGRSLHPRADPFDIDEVLDAVASFHAAIEIPDSRYVDFATVGAPQIIADNACGHYFAEAEATGVDWRGMDLANHKPVGEVVGHLKREGSGTNVLGDPRVALAWLVNELRAIGITLAEGQIVTTGTCMAPLPVKPGDRVVADFGVLGRASVLFV
ncbi:2-keto-4-pentenoate hydratase [Pseudochelatococcus sp. B33]